MALKSISGAPQSEELSTYANLAYSEPRLESDPDSISPSDLYIS